MAKRTGVVRAVASLSNVNDKELANTVLPEIIVSISSVSLLKIHGASDLATAVR